VPEIGTAPSSQGSSPVPRLDERITEDIAAMYLTGISTRPFAAHEETDRRSLSHAEVSNATPKLQQAVEHVENP